MDRVLQKHSGLVGPEELTLQALSPDRWVYSSFIGSDSRFVFCILYWITLGMQVGEGAGNCLPFTQTSMAKQDYRGWVIARHRVSEIKFKFLVLLFFPKTT